ncbi:hypothetical protein LAB1_23620 [Roseibium sp. LAB1]
MEVGGKVVKIERVIKCLRSSRIDGQFNKVYDYATTPPIIGAKIPGSKSAIYMYVPFGCIIKLGSHSDIPEYRPFKDDEKPAIIWTDNSETFNKIEFYTSPNALKGIGSHIKFIKLDDPIPATKADFIASEKRALKVSPDLTPFVSLDDREYRNKTKIYVSRFGDQEYGPTTISCYAVWIIPRSDWIKVPRLSRWVDSLPKDQLAHKLPYGYLTKEFKSKIKYTNGSLSYGRIDEPTPRDHERYGRFKSYNEIHPIIYTDSGAYFDLNLSGYFGCISPGHQKQRFANFQIDAANIRRGSVSSEFVYKRRGTQISAPFPNHPYFVPELDSFVVQVYSPMGPSRISEPVAMGWKEY